MNKAHWMAFRRGLAASLLLAVAAIAASTPADAQRYQRGGGGGGFFESLFGPRTYAPTQRDFGEPQQQVDSSRAPAPKKSDATPTLTVMVMGDSMADWLGYGLEEAFADSPEIGVVRKHKTNSGLIRYEPRSDLDWWHVARETLGKEKVDFVVMMLGINDRVSIRETAADKKKEQAAKEQAAKEQAGQNTPADQTAKADDDDEAPASEPRQRGASGVAEFRSERWEQIYVKRIDETLAALKSKGVPVLWVGLPPIRGTRSTADVQYLNDLFRARAEAAGVVYVDVWDGFVDEAGKFTYSGPDFEGQTRRLRSGDGVHFTKQGARKLAHYAERELRRFISNRSMPMAMPSGGATLQGTEPAARPVAGPVVPLTGAPAGGEELLGGAGNRPVHSDATATRVLVRGEPVAPVPGRADDFQWPRGGEANAAVEPLSPTAAAARAEPPKPEPKPETKKPAAPPAAKEAARETKPAMPEKREKPIATQPAATMAKPKPPPPVTAAADPNRPRPPARIQQVPPQQQRQPSGGGLFGLFR